MGCSDKGDGHPTLYIAACPQVEMFPFFREAAIYAFKSNLRLHLHAKETVHQDDGQGEVATFLK